MAKFDIVGIEMPCIDLNLNVEKFPTSNGGARVLQTSWQGGGKVASGMVAAARLGANCAIMGAVGDDIYGRFCVKDFKAHGIDVEYLKMRENSTTGMSVVLSNYEDRGRSIMYTPGSAARWDNSEISLDYIRNAKYFFFAYTDEHTEKLIDVAREAGVKVFVDADGYSERLMQLVPKIDVFVASEFVYNALYKDEEYEKNCRAVLDMGPEIVVFTLGPKGCVGVSREEGFFRLETYDVPVHDTVGAGDVYHGAFLAGLLSGRSPRDTADLANAVSSIKCTRIGGRAGIPDMPTVERFMRDGFIDYTEIDKRVEYYKRGLDNV